MTDYDWQDARGDELDRIEDRARRELMDHILAERTREAAIIAAAPAYGTLVRAIAAGLDVAICEEVEAGWREWAEESAEAEMERTDPYRYYGISRRDFL